MIAIPAALLANRGLIVAGAAVALAAGLGWAVNGWRLGAEIEALKADHSRQVAESQQATAKAQKTQRDIEAAREAAKQEVDHVSRLARDRADSDRAAADAAHERMLYAAAIAAGRASAACKDSAASGERQAASDAPVRTFLDVLREAGEEAGRMGAAADEARAAGLGCERLHDSLNP